MDSSMELENKQIINILTLGANVSIVQSILFFVIAATGLALGAFIFNSEAAVLLGLGFTAALFGPVCHAWIAVIFRNRCKELKGIHE